MIVAMLEYQAVYRVIVAICGLFNSCAVETVEWVSWVVESLDNLHMRIDTLIGEGE